MFFERLNDVWDTLPEPFYSFYRIGSFGVQICFHDLCLNDKLSRAFAHLVCDRFDSDLTIRLWNCPKLPPLDWDLIQRSGYRGYAKPPFYFHYFECIGALSAVDTERGIAYYIVRDPAILPWWVSASPLQVILHAWFREKGIQLTHSACISNGKKGILLVGKGGSGKSTTVLSCLRENLATLGEDYLLLAPDCAYSVYQTAKWMPHTRTLFPWYESYIANPDTADEQKALVHYLDLFPSQLISSSSFSKVVSLELANTARLQSSDARTSLQSMLLTTVMQLPHSDPWTARFLYERMKPLDHYRLSLGCDLKKNVDILKELLE